MNGFTPNCLDDFLFSNPADKRTLELILSRKLPFPFGGKTGILLHGTWGSGKTTLAELLPELLETAYRFTVFILSLFMVLIALHEMRFTLHD